MTKMTPEAIAWREMLEKEKPNWPRDLVEAATHVRFELEGMRLKSWEPSGGPAALKRYMDRFDKLYAAHKANNPVRDVEA